MAFPLVHLLVAAKAAESIPSLHGNGSYLLGTNAPDAIHMRGGITSKSPEKRATHLFAQGDGTEAVDTYWREVGITPFTIGYGVHILADCAWSNYYRMAFPVLIDADGFTIPEVYKPEVALLDAWLYWHRVRHMDLLPLALAAQAPGGSQTAHAR